MAETWQQLAQDNRTAAFEAFDRRRWRTCVSRCYYSVFDLVSHQAELRKVQMPTQREGPTHRQLTRIVTENLGLHNDIAGELVGVCGKSYELRILADYYPSSTCSERTARDALRLVRRCFQLLEEQ
ncbi:MAG: HEPN domain-containing protein [Planctomycetota bacterium]